MNFCNEMEVGCEFAKSNGFCSISACRKIFSVTYEAYSCFPLTNADRIRAMSDEELAASDYIPCPYDNGGYGECKFGWHEPEQTCEECKLEWLRMTLDSK